MPPQSPQGYVRAPEHLKPSASRVLARLRAAEGGWVRGNDLALVGGWRFGGRIHELRRLGYVIERRTDPKSAVAQYRLVERAAA